MGKDKKSRSRRPSENKQEPASRSASASTAVRVPLLASSPRFKSITGDSSDHDEELQTEPNSDGANSPEDLKNPQNQYASQVGRDPGLTDDGPLASPQIEPSLGEIVEESVKSRAGKDTQSPTNTDQSTSPDAQGPSFNLADELEGVRSDGSGGDMRSEAGDQGTSPIAVPAEGAPEAGDVSSGHSESIQEEKRKRLAAEERLSTLKAAMKDQQQRFEEEAENAKKKHEQALQKVNKAREAEKVKLELKNNTISLEVAKYEEMIEALTQLEDPGQPIANDVSNQKEKPAMDPKLLQAITKEINAGSGMDPIGRLPMASKGGFKPGSARVLLAECEFLLDKSTPVYTALRVMADYADGGRDRPSEKDKKMLGDFDGQLEGIIKLMEKHMKQPIECLKESRNDWELAMGQLGVREAVKRQSTPLPYQ